MRTLRLSLIGTVSLALLGGLSVAIGADDGESNGGFTLSIVGANEEWDRWQVEASDPRLSGTWTHATNCHENASPYFEVCVTNMRVANEGGTWLGRSETSGAASPSHFVGWTVLEGQGDYEGLTAFAHYDEARMGDDPEIDGMGVIFDIELSMPELPAE